MKKRPNIKRAVFTATLVIAVALAVLLMFGGEGFRWFGQKSGDVGEAVREHSEELGERADELKEDIEEKADEFKEGAQKKAGAITEDVKKKVKGD